MSRREKLRQPNNALKMALANSSSKDGEDSPTEEYDDGRKADSSLKSDDELEEKPRQKKETDSIDDSPDIKQYEIDLDRDADIVLPYSVMTERAKYIPIRLTYEERKVLRLVNACITVMFLKLRIWYRFDNIRAQVSDYTTTIDSINFKTNAKRNHSKLQNICGFLSGIVSSLEYKKGQQLLEDRNFSDYEAEIQEYLEISRRYKIMNPEKMRSEYGKLVLLMQDAVSSDIKPLLGIHIQRPIITVYDLLDAKNALNVLKNKYIDDATQEVLPNKSKSRYAIQVEIKKKEKAIEVLSNKYCNNLITAEEIRQCLYSISDNNSFLNSNLLPIQECITLLKTYFKPTSFEPGYSLAIQEGASGSRLTHSHELQYNYVLQSLTLWASIVQDMFRLWYLAELDLLSETTPYELKNTGQGLQRVQQSPHVYRAMFEILTHTQRQLGSWVGSSVIHLGDNNVPNALVFIDKYTQVSRILGPLVKTLSMLESACAEDNGLKRYIESYGGIDKAKKDVLHDFFTHAFDGSGGDNFFDAGSCIDGRLTSAWHWCSQLSTKPYYPLFRLTGFLSFDGEFYK